MIRAGLNILYESEEQIKAKKAKLDEMWATNGQEMKRIPGTRKAHCLGHTHQVLYFSLTSDCEIDTCLVSDLVTLLKVLYVVILLKIPGLVSMLNSL